MDEKITIIEGPPPTFEVLDEGWAFGLVESHILYDIAVTHLRTFNGPALVERCHRAWRNQETIHLEYRDQDGLEQKAPIVAARAVDAEGGQVLILWVRTPRTDTEVEIEFTDELDEDQFGDITGDDIDDFDFDDEDDDDLYGSTGRDSDLLPPSSW